MLPASIKDYGAAISAEFGHNQKLEEMALLDGPARTCYKIHLEMSVPNKLYQSQQLMYQKQEDIKQKKEIWITMRVEAMLNQAPVMMKS